MNSLRKYLEDFAALIYPNLCLNCRRVLVRGERLICLRCSSDLPLSSCHLLQPNPIIKQMASLVPMANAFCLMKYRKGGVAKKLLAELKYKSNKEVGIMLGKWFGTSFREALSDANIDRVIPIPLHPRKKRTRGFNQSEVIAQGIQQVIPIPVMSHWLIRTKYTNTQAKTKEIVDRIKNVSEIYELTCPEEVTGKTVMLLDDVITTGSTMAGAAELLMLQGRAAKVYIACIASGI